MPILNTIKFKGHRCFGSEWAGFDEIRPINVIIGRNNTGKSQLLDLVEHMCGGKVLTECSILYRVKLDESLLETQFSRAKSQGDLRGNYWDDHGQFFVGQTMEWEALGGSVGEVRFPDGFDLTSQFGEASTNGRYALQEIARRCQHPFNGKRFRRLLADRDLRPEAEGKDLGLEPDGSGATNIVRRYLLSSSRRLPRELIQGDLLKALNEIFAHDGEFTEIQIQSHDEADSEYPGTWEIFLGEENKGPISLSKSGSGLKTVFLVLLNLLIPKIEGHPNGEFVFALEELENNLHPALLRRLFRFVEKFALRENATFFLTTHSNVALDQFATSAHAQIIRVTHDGTSARSMQVSTHFDQLGVVSELGAKPSDLLQANGIIWVEGPSDRIYVNRWLDLFTDGVLMEGRDYQCAFYGGSLLARTQFTSLEEAQQQLVNLFRLNSSVIVICDGDRSEPCAQLKSRVERIEAEVLKIPGAFMWTTGAREMENYIPGEVISKAMGVADLRDPDQYEAFFPRKGQPGGSYVETQIRRASYDKMDLAFLVAPLMELLTMSMRFDWPEKMSQMVERIREWNK